jgi:predicted transcriptional regulator
VPFGRKRTLTKPQSAELQARRKQGELIKTLMKEYGLSKASVYRYLNESDPSLSAQNAQSR